MGRFFFFGSKEDQQLLHEESSSKLPVDTRIVTLDKSQGDVGITVANAADGSGVVIIGLEQAGLAEQAGLKEGDTLAAACGKEIASHDEALKLLRNAKGSVELRIRRAARKSTRSIISSLLFGLRPLVSAVSGRTLAVMVSPRRRRSWWSCLTQRRKSQAQLTADV